MPSGPVHAVLVGHWLHGEAVVIVHVSRCGVSNLIEVSEQHVS